MADGWTCPSCARWFAARRGHTCAPPMALDDWLGRHPEVDPAAVEAVLSHVESLGPVEVEAVAVGILVRGARTFVELRPRRAGLRLSVVLPHDVQSPRVRQRVVSPAGWTAVLVDLASPDDVDDEVRGWLTESYEEFRPG